MEIHNVGYNFRHGKDFRVNRPYGSGDYVIILTRSRAVFELDGGENHVNYGTVMMYKKGTAQIFGADGEEFVNDWVHFDASDSEILPFGTAIPFNCPFVLDDAAEFSEIFARMSREMYSNGRFRKEITENYLKILLYKLSEQLTKTAGSVISPYYARFTEIRADVYNMPSKYRSVSEAAEAAHISESYFQHLYKEQFGKSFISDVILSRMERARYLLTHTEYRVCDIAYELGYSAEEQFMRQFKRETGITPTKYRKKYSISLAVLASEKDKAPYNF